MRSICGTTAPHGRIASSTHGCEPRIDLGVAIYADAERVGSRRIGPCAAYGNGNFIVRGFGPAAFQLNGPRGGSDPAVNKAAAKGAPVEQEIAVTVSADKIECAINGKVVGSYPKADVVTAGKLKSTDGLYGIRFAHNTDGIVTGLTMTKNK